jgi:phage terminase large subunit-like protein
MPRPKKRPVIDQGDPDRVTATDVISFIQRHCRIPEGKNTGKLITLQPWQSENVRLVYDNPATTRRAIFSFGRKNGKSSSAACLLLAHLCGPPARSRPNSQLYSAAQSRDQASVTFSYAAKMVRLDPVLSRIVRVKESTKELICPDLGTHYRALSAEVGTAHGLSPSFIIFDELGQCRGPRSGLYEALETATGAQQDPLSIIISTQAPTDADLLSVLIDDAQAGHDPQTVLRLYTAPVELDPFDEATIRMANPAFGTFQNPREVLAMAQNARRMPAREAEFRNLVLNQRVEVSNPFIAPGVWKSCNEPPGPLDGLALYGGLDLSATNDLTALVLIGWRDGKWRVQPTFWLPAEGLAEKSASDRVPYDQWHSQGHLIATPGRAVSYEYVANYLRELFGRYRIERIGFDRWNMKHLSPWLVKAGMSESMIKAKFVEFGQGFQSLSPAMRDLEQVILDGKLAHGDHPVLGMCIHNTIVQTDDAGNRKPSKKKSTGRIDGLVALCMAIGVSAKPGAAIDFRNMIA